MRQKSPLSADRTPACSGDLASSRCEIGSSGSSPVLAAHLPPAFAAGAAGVEIKPAGAGIAAGGRDSLSIIVYPCNPSHPTCVCKATDSNDDSPTTSSSSSYHYELTSDGIMQMPLSQSSLINLPHRYTY